MLCVWWNFEDLIHWEFVPNSIQSMWIFILNNLNEFMKFWDGDTQHELTKTEFSCSRIMREPHTARIITTKVQKLGEINTARPLPAYSSDLVPSDYHLFWSMAHFLHGRNFENIEAVEMGLNKFFAPNTRDWYRCGIINLDEKRLKTIESHDLYFLLIEQKHTK